MKTLVNLFLLLSFSGQALAKECKVDPKVPSGFRFRIDWEAKYGVRSNEIYPFITDGCSRVPGWIEGDASFLACCEIHDIAYWTGLGGDEARLQADDDLYTCVTFRKNKAIGSVIYSGPKSAAALNTGTLLPTEYRWGYGWPYVLGKDGTINEEQKASIRELMYTIIPSIEENRRQRCYPKLSPGDRSAIEAAIFFLEQKLK